MLCLSSCLNLPWNKSTADAVASGDHLQSGTYSYARGQARIRSCCQDIDCKGNGEAGEASVDEGISGQRGEPVSRVHKQDRLLIQEAGNHLLWIRRRGKWIDNIWRTWQFRRLSFWHTAHFSTFPALLAHFTKARRRTNSCLVRLANWTISIFLKPIQRFNICSTMSANNERMTWWNWEPYLSMSVFLGRLMNEQTKKKKKSIKCIKTTMQVKFWSVSSSLTRPHMTLASMCQHF